MQDAQAGQTLADVVHTSDAGNFIVFKEKKLLEPFRPEGVDKFDKTYVDTDNQFVVWRIPISVIAYNTKAVSEADAPKSWKDLADPKWKGKLVHSHPGYSGGASTTMAALSKLLGWDYYSALVKNDPMVVQSILDTTKTIASGERAVAAHGMDYNLLAAVAKGNPIKVVFPEEGVIAISAPSGVVKGAPHPNAAKLFTNFTFTREIMQYLADAENLYVPHPEVTYKDKVKLSQLKVISPDAKELNDRAQEIKDKFGVLFKQ